MPDTEPQDEPENTDQPNAPMPPEGAPPASLPVDPNEPLAIDPAVDAGATRTLFRLLSARPFSDLYQKVGAGNLKFRGWVCFVFDFLFRLAVILLLIGIIFAVAWKTFAPLPPFWDERPAQTEPREG